MKKILSVVALSVALGLSGMGFKTSEAVTSECEASTDLSVATVLDNELEDGDLKGKIVNSSGNNDYDEIMVRLDFYGADGAIMGTDEAEIGNTDIKTDLDNSATMQRDTDIDVDVDADLEDGELDADVDTEAEAETDLNHDSGSLGENSSSLTAKSAPLHSQVITINEDVEAGEVEEFEIDVTPPAGATRVVATVVCAD